MVRSIFSASETVTTFSSPDERSRFKMFVKVSAQHVAFMNKRTIDY